MAAVIMTTASTAVDFNAYSGPSGSAPRIIVAAMAIATHAATPATATRFRSPTFGIVTCPGKAPELTAVETDARAFWIASPGNGEIRPERLASPSPDDVVVRALYSGISRGTEALVF